MPETVLDKLLRWPSSSTLWLHQHRIVASLDFTLAPILSRLAGVRRDQAAVFAQLSKVCIESMLATGPVQYASIADGEIQLASVVR